MSFLSQVILDALLRIEEIKAVLPNGMLNAGMLRSESGINLEAPVTLWEETHAALKKRFPIFQPIAPSTKQPANQQAAKQFSGPSRTPTPFRSHLHKSSSSAKIH